jgi:hypothetical protein
MPRYSESRATYPERVALRLTKEQKRRALAIAALLSVSLNEAIRRGVDREYLFLFSSSSIDQTIQSDEGTQL